MNRKYKNLVIYYFSGTGNAKYCAAWICELADRMGIRSTMIDIGKTEVANIEAPSSETLVGFCSPTHGFHFPQITRRFIRRFPSATNGAEAFILNTRAGVRLFNIVVPGLSGVLHYISSLTLIMKGYKIVGLFPVDLPSNWISLHPAIEKKGTEIIYAGQKLRVTRFAEKILSGRHVYRALYDIVQDVFISPVTLGYLVVGRFIFSKSYFASRDCNACLRCLKECPVGAIKMIDGRMFWTSKCESCMKCMNRCPKNAIETPHGFLFAFFCVFSLVVPAGLTSIINHYYAIPYLTLVNNGLVRFLIVSAIMLPLYFASYRIMHFLMRFSLVERVMTLTSLTHLKYWGRYKAPDRF